MPIRIIHQDITTINCGAIVNPTDSSFSGSGGTDRAIHAAAGMELDIECRKLAPLNPGEAVVTSGYALPCKYLIHTMGPLWQGGDDNETMLLRNCYINSLLNTKSLGVQSIVFPLISSGKFGFPRDIVLKIATDAISDFLFNVDSELDVSICVHDRFAFEPGRAADLFDYLYAGRDSILENTRTDLPERRHELFDADECKSCAPIEAPYASETRKVSRSKSAAKIEHSVLNIGIPNLSEWIKKQDKSFSELLLELIEQKQMNEVECYKKANVSKNTFSKIKNADKPVPYQPSKPTVIAFAISLELSMAETDQLLKSAGFSLSHNNLFDMIIEFYITNRVYDIFEINAALYQYDQVCLGC